VDGGLGRSTFVGSLLSLIGCFGGNGGGGGGGVGLFTFAIILCFE
jgi:hypothetical protein